MAAFIFFGLRDKARRDKMPLTALEGVAAAAALADFI